MQYSDDRHCWVLDKSPHTGQAKTQSRRIYANKTEELDGQGNIVALLNPNGRTFLRVGMDVPVQPGRLSRAVGRHKLLEIRKQDARRISGADAAAEGYQTPWHFLIDAWLPMHDPDALDQVVLPGDLHALSSIPPHVALSARPPHRYLCHALTFERLRVTDVFIREHWGLDKGQQVLVRDLAEYGTVIEIKEGKVLVAFGKSSKPGVFDPWQVERT